MFLSKYLSSVRVGPLEVAPWSLLATTSLTDFRYKCNYRERQRQIRTKTKTITKTATNSLMDYWYKDNQRQTKGQEQLSSLPLFSFSLFIHLFFLSLFYSPKMPQVVFGTMLVWSELITSHAIRWAVVICLFVFCILHFDFAFCRFFCISWCKIFDFSSHNITLQGANTSAPHPRGGRGHLELQVQDVLQGSPGQICLCL